MFYIIRDILVKEVLYPPSNFHTSFRHRFECWKRNKSSLFAMRSSFNKYEKKETSKKIETLSVKNAKEPLVSDESPSFRKDGGTNNESKLSSNSHIRTKIETDSKSLPQEVKTDAGKTGKSSQQENSRTIKTDSLDTESEICHKPYRSYKNSRPENTKKRPPDNQNDATTLLRQLQENKSNGEEKIERKEFGKIQDESSLAVTSLRTPNEQQGGNTYTKLSKEYREYRISKTAPKKASSSISHTYGTPDMNDGGKREIIKEILKNPTPRKTVCNQREEHTATLSTKIHETPGAETELSKKIILAKTPSKIPVKSMHYGPPAPFSQSPKAAKEKRASVAHRISHCRGDTSERDRKSKKKKSGDDFGFKYSSIMRY